MANKHKNIGSSSLVISEMQNKTTVNNVTHIPHSQKCWSLTILSVSKEQQGLLYIAGGNVKGAATVGKVLVVSHKFDNFASRYIPHRNTCLCALEYILENAKMATN